MEVIKIPLDVCKMGEFRRREREREKEREREREKNALGLQKSVFSVIWELGVIYNQFVTFRFPACT